MISLFEGMDFFDCMNMANGDPIVAAMMHTDANRPAPKQKTERKLGRHSVEYLQQQAERKKRLKRD